MEYRQELPKKYNKLPVLAKTINFGKKRKSWGLSNKSGTNQKTGSNNEVWIEALKILISYFACAKLLNKVNLIRKLAKNESEKEFFKLMNKSVCEKSKESIRSHKKVKLVRNQ